MSKSRRALARQLETVIADAYPEDYMLARHMATGIIICEVWDPTGRASQWFQKDFMRLYPDVKSGEVSWLKLLQAALRYAELHTEVDRKECVAEVLRREYGVTVLDEEESCP